MQVIDLTTAQQLELVVEALEKLGGGPFQVATAERELP